LVYKQIDMGAEVEAMIRAQGDYYDPFFFFYEYRIYFAPWFSSKCFARI